MYKKTLNTILVAIKDVDLNNNLIENAYADWVLNINFIKKVSGLQPDPESFLSAYSRLVKPVYQHIQYRDNFISTEGFASFIGVSNSVANEVITNAGKVYQAMILAQTEIQQTN